MPDDALALVEILDENYDDTDPRNRVYEAKLLICLAQLQHTRGAAYDYLLHKAVAVGGNNREDRRHIACVRALAGELDAAIQPVNTAFRAIDRLLDIHNRSSTSYPPFYHVKPEDRIAAATEMAKHFDNVHVRAAALCKVANALSGTDPAAAKLLVDLAWEAAVSSDRMESISGFSPELIQPSWAFKQLAESYARCGWPMQAMSAADRVSDKIDEALTTRGGRTATHRQGVVQGICQLVAQTDRPFVEDQGREIFELLRRLETCDDWPGPPDTAGLVGRFAQLEQWNQAVRALEFCQSEMAETADGISISTVRPLLEHNQQHRLSEMLDVCSDQGRQRLITRYCSFSNGHQWRPERETVELVRSMTDLDTANRTVRQFLLGGYWAIGDEVIAYELIDHLTENEDSDTPRQNYFALELAMNQRLPALALELIAVREDDDSRLRFLQHTARMMASDQEQLQQLENWVANRPVVDQAVVQIGLAQALLDKD